MFGYEKQQDISIDKLRAGDDVIINTETHLYRFKMVDPVNRRGTLSGGLLGKGECEAALLGAVGGDLDRNANSSIRTQAKVVFFLKGQNDTTRLCTSLITNLKLLRPTDSWGKWFKTIAEKTAAAAKTAAKDMKQASDATFRRHT